MIDYERPIKNALARLNTPDGSQRMQVYRSAMQAFENRLGNEDPAFLAERKNLLANTIQKIEMEYVARAKPPPVQPAPVIVAPPEPVRPELIETPKRQMAATLAPVKSLVSRINVKVLASGSIALLIGIGVIYAQTGTDNTQASVSETRRIAITSSLSVAEVSTLFDANFESGNGLLSLSSNELDPALGKASQAIEGALKTTTGEQKNETEYRGMYSKDLIEISPKKIYSATAYVRYNTDSEITIRPNLYIGIATFAKGEAEQNAKSGDHRYFVINGQPPKRASPDKEGWIKLTGEITGIGKSSHKTFKKGSVYARPVVLVSTRPVNSTIELKSFTFGEIE